MVMSPALDLRTDGSFDKCEWDKWLSEEKTWCVFVREDFQCHPELFLVELHYQAAKRDREVQAIIHGDEVWFRAYFMPNETGESTLLSFAEVKE